MPEARYEIIRQLACGGMAEVLLARQNDDDGTSRLVVLKRVLAHLAQNDSFLKMFAHEARIASQLRHLNIVQVLEVGEHEGLPVIVMERLEGADLLRLLQQCVTRRQSLGTAVSMAILAGAARGLGYAHRARSSDGRALRLIHRDISPHNVFITRDGGVKLLDFGIAKSAAHVGLTSTGQVKGKISYMSPEQIRSLPIDARSDLWSLGVVLWETLAGEKLFTRDNDAATLHAILHDPIPLLNRREAPGLDELIARVLQRDPVARVGTAEEIVAALEAMLEAMRAGPAVKLVAQRVASLVPAISPEFDLARPVVVHSQEVVTLALGHGGPSAPKHPIGRTMQMSPAPPALNRYSRASAPPPDVDVAVDSEPTMMDIPTSRASVPPDDETTRAVMLPSHDDVTIARGSPQMSPAPRPIPAARPVATPPMRTSAPPMRTSAPPMRTSTPPRPPASPDLARPPSNPRSRIPAVLGTRTTPPGLSHLGLLSDEVDPPTAQLPRPATLAPPRPTAPTAFPMAPVLPSEDLFGPAHNQYPSSAASFVPSNINAIRPAPASPFSINPLAGFAGRSPDTFVAAEIVRPPPTTTATARTARWLVAAGSLVLAATLGALITQGIRSPTAPRAPMAASVPMPVIHVPVAVAAPPPAPVAVAAPPPAPVAVAAPPPAPVAVAAPGARPRVTAAAPPPAPVAVAAPVARPRVTAPAPPPVARPVAVTPLPVARPVAATTRAADPFTNVYSDPTQRRPVVRPRVQAPPSAHSGAIITEF